MIPGAEVKLKREATFDKLVLMGIKPEVADFMIKQSRFIFEKDGPVIVKIKVKNRSIDIFKKYIEEVV